MRGSPFVPLDVGKTILFNALRRKPDLALNPCLETNYILFDEQVCAVSQAGVEGLEE